MGWGPQAPKQVTPPTDWLTRRQSSSYAKEWELQISMEGNIIKLLKAIQQGTTIDVSDRSFQSRAGTTAWIIEGQDATNRIVGSSFIPGHTKDHSSFWSKAAGIYGLLLTLKEMINNTAITGKVLVACDGKSVLDWLKSTQDPDPSAAHADLLQAIQTLWSKLPFCIVLEHMKGHQDAKETTALTRAAWLNIKADLRAKGCMAPSWVGPLHFQLPFEPWVVEHEGRWIVKILKKAIWDACNGPQAHQYWL